MKVELAGLGLFLTLGNITPRLRVVDLCDDDGISGDDDDDDNIGDDDEVDGDDDVDPPEDVDIDVDEDIETKTLIGVVDGGLAADEPCNDDDVGKGVVVVDAGNASDANSSFNAMYLFYKTS